jgi:AraC-like DNA-binding protein
VFFGRDTPLTLPAQVRHLRVRENVAQVEMNQVLDMIAREMASDRPAADRAARHHLGLLSVWLERQIAAQPEAELPHRDSARRLAARYAALLEREFHSGKGVADYAADLGVTPTHLTRVCRVTMGRPAKALLHDRVIFEARRLLQDTPMPVGHVAQALGFRSPAYFTRAFHHHTGQTPTAFRRTP